MPLKKTLEFFHNLIRIPKVNSLTACCTIIRVFFLEVGAERSKRHQSYKTDTSVKMEFLLLMRNRPVTCRLNILAKLTSYLSRNTVNE